MTKKKDIIAELAGYIGKCYKTDFADVTAYAQVTGVAMDHGKPMEYPLEITHVLVAPDIITFRRGMLTPDDLKTETVGTQEIPVEQYREEVGQLMTENYAVMSAPGKSEREHIVRLLKGEA